MPDKEVVVYSTPTCPFCKKTKDYLNQKGIAYSDINVAADKEKAKEMIQMSGQMGVPVIVVDGQLVVGFNQAKIDELLAK
jgi:glutaredoxin-like YruB-family protein